MMAATTYEVEVRFVDGPVTVVRVDWAGTPSAGIVQTAITRATADTLAPIAAVTVLNSYATPERMG